MKIVVDTNVLIASVGNKAFYNWLFKKIISGQLSLCISNHILYEYLEIIERKTTPSIAERIVAAILTNPKTIFVSPYYKWNLIDNDKEDNKFVDCCLAAVQKRL